MPWSTDDRPRVQPSTALVEKSVVSCTFAKQDSWDDAVRYVEKLAALRREYGRESEPFDITLALLEVPTADLFRRAEDIGITAVMCAPWMGEGVEPRNRDGCHGAIERFAETVIAQCR